MKIAYTLIDAAFTKKVCRAVFFFLLCCFFSCQNASPCTQLDNRPEQQLEGNIYLNSKGEIWLESTADTSLQKVLLLPCEEALRDYVFSYYDAFIHLKRKKEDCKVSVSGAFISATEPRFLFNFVAMLEE